MIFGLQRADLSALIWERSLTVFLLDNQLLTIRSAEHFVNKRYL
jgi:hypothetical protein